MNGNEVFILIGVDFGEDLFFANCKDVHKERSFLGVYNLFEHAIKVIKDYEQDKDNYVCSDCEFFDDSFHYSEITEEQFKERKCPKCGGILEYCPAKYEKFEVLRYTLNEENQYSKKEIVYTAEFSQTDKKVKQWILPELGIPVY